MMTRNYDVKELIKSNDQRVNSHTRHQSFRGNGKFLLSGEYLILDGAKGLALPTKLGQNLSVRYSQSFDPCLRWRSYDHQGKLWFDASFEFWHFDIIESKAEQEHVKYLQNLLRSVRKQNQHFLRDEGHVEVETFIDFPLDWGLGSSSTLIYNLAQWAYVGVYELFFNNSNGSGYDIACAQSNGPIVYQKNEDGPKWELSNFAPNYKDKLSFVYLGKKVRSDKEINNISKYRPFSEKSISYMNGLTEDLLNINDEKQFMEWVLAHESFLSELLERESVNNKFSDFNGVIKSLGAWGGDFVLVCSSDSPETVKEYFQSRGFKDIFRYDQIIAETSEMNHLRQ